MHWHKFIITIPVMKNIPSHHNKAGKNFLAVAEAMAMNAAPEYWMSIKLAAVHLFALFMVARQFFIQQ
jgi:hypothetical protein